ncbi:sodium/proline symporter [Thalassotalea psychrophila]|uniref:Sodium/proline symporter n=1 Tax=Thalassotalea psychrophila TaxID=3065647 RepID=A0ABY9TUD2_9GAMM|nr:sodium/proline symporter [Colwelliaceae bacterium SQ149]
MFEKYLMLIIYFAVLIGLSYIASKQVKNLKDYFTGGKSLGYLVAAFSTQATGESAWLLLGLTGMGALVGVSAYWIVVGEVIGVAIAWFVMAQRFKKLTDLYDSITMTDYLVSRFRPTTNTLRLVAAFSLSIFVLIYISAQIDATGSAFERFLGWDYYLGAIIGFVIVVIYCVMGGFLAVAWTDMFQGAVMLLCLCLLPIVAYFMLADSDNIITGLQAIDPNLLNISGAYDFNLMGIMSILGMLFIGIGFLGSPQIFARFIAIRDKEELNKGRWVAVVFTFLVGTSAVTIGIIGRYIFTSVGVDPEATLGNGGQNVLPNLVEHTFPPLIVGLYVAAVLSAIMSTVSSLLILASGAITNDFYRKIINPELRGKSAARISRYVTIGLAIVALGIALSVAILSPDRTIFWFVIFGWSGIAATFCPMVILSLFWKNYTASGAIASMIVGFISIPFFKFAAPNIDGIGQYFVALESLPPAFCASLIAGYLVCKIMPNQSINEDYAIDLQSIHSQATD